MGRPTQTIEQRQRRGLVFYAWLRHLPLDDKYPRFHEAGTGVRLLAFLVRRWAAAWS